MKKVIFTLVVLLSIVLTSSVKGEETEDKVLDTGDYPSIVTISLGPSKEEREALIEEFLVYFENAKLANDVANSLVGKGGDCFYIVKLFFKKYLGITFSKELLTQIPEEDAIPGDIIYYKNGGLGLQHWAVYLGEERALQGCYNGKAKIDVVHMRNASSPIFYTYER